MFFFRLTKELKILLIIKNILLMRLLLMLKLFDVELADLECIFIERWENRKLTFLCVEEVGVQREMVSRNKTLDSRNKTSL